MSNRHTPERTCVICGTKAAKRELIRVVFTPTGGCVVDELGKRNGRGAYLCHRDSCWDRAIIGGKLSHALRGNVTDEDKEGLSSYRRNLRKTPEPNSPQ